MSKTFLKLAAIPAFITATSGAVFAALPAEVATEITAAKTDMLQAIGMVIAAMVAVWALKKLGSKMGWL